MQNGKDAEKQKGMLYEENGKKLMTVDTAANTFTAKKV
jgi:hypothetical protein